MKPMDADTAKVIMTDLAKEHSFYIFSAIEGSLKNDIDPYNIPVMSEWIQIRHTIISELRVV